MNYSHGGTYKRCFESHPPLKIGEYVVYGGSCSSPIVTDADVYVGFDYSMKKSPLAYPWNSGDSFLFPITDMAAPSDPAEFHKLIQWLELQLIAQKKVHLGCIGGHGRTGTVLAALVKHMTGNEDAVTYVRENYCKKAVESAVQVAFLVKHYGIKEVEGAKEGQRDWDSQGDLWAGRKSHKQEPKPHAKHKSAPHPFTPTSSTVKAVWGPNVTY